MSPVRWVSAITATGAGLWLVATLSGISVASHGDVSARLRLSWSARPERIEVCRVLSAEELATREVHMRQRLECEGTTASYLLRVEVDGATVGESVIRGSGLRHDRPLYLLRDYAVSAGRHRIRVSFTRREAVGKGAVDSLPAPTEPDTGLFAGRSQREVAERARTARAALPSALVLDTLIEFPSNRVVLVTFDAEQRMLTLLAEGGRR